ncbi:Uncharacterised protein [Fusobacterium necrogenes]|uniref:Uncharacterized protein n=1 Tax=Fusobacterium necrogenes TaxID=858 RepID=A0A377GW09_9FUSO|nr:hypothetical protein [Fusobacterium necrogenes]STO30711.1 Uncharacterised protein [Fusobacterium necrogenes]
MKNRKGFYFIDTLFQISLVLLLLSFGLIYFRKLIEREELIKAKTEIYEVFTTYAIKAFNSRTSYDIELDYLKKKITISKMSVIDKEVIHLPRKLKYISIFEKQTQVKFKSKITSNGNITPSFSIYIFGYDNIAKYRISFYGFDLIKYMQINVYKNIDDKTAKYDNILLFHNKWTTANPKWKEE